MSPWVQLRVRIALRMRHCYHWNGFYALNWLAALDSQLRMLLVIIALSATQMTLLIFLICLGFFACFTLLITHWILMFYAFQVKNMKYARVATGVVWILIWNYYYKMIYFKISNFYNYYLGWDFPFYWLTDVMGHYGMIVLLRKLCRVFVVKYLP